MKIIGFQYLEEALDDLVSHADTYVKGGVKLPHFILNISKGNGQTYIANYIKSVLFENGLRKFTGLDTILEYRLDGSLKNIQRMFEDISGNAVYSNEYEGVVVIDVSALHAYVNEHQVDYFIENIAEVGQHATVIIYYDNSLGKRMKILKDRIAEVLGNNIEVCKPKYDVEDYTSIIIQNMKERGVIFKHEQDLFFSIGYIIPSMPIENAKDAVAFADELMFFAKYVGLFPVIDAIDVDNYFSENDEYGGDVV